MTEIERNFPLLLTRKQASQLTGLDEKYFDRLRIEGRVRTYRTLGGLHRFYRHEILAHIGFTFPDSNPSPK